MSLHISIIYGIYVVVNGHILDYTYMVIGCEINVAVYWFFG